MASIGLLHEVHRDDLDGHCGSRSCSQRRPQHHRHSPCRPDAEGFAKMVRDGLLRRSCILELLCKRVPLLWVLLYRAALDRELLAYQSYQISPRVGSRLFCLCVLLAQLKKVIECCSLFNLRGPPPPNNRASRKIEIGRPQ